MLNESKQHDLCMAVTSFISQNLCIWNWYPFSLGVLRVAPVPAASLDHCCHLSNEVLNIDRRQDIPYTLQQVAKLFIVAPNIAHSVGGGDSGPYPIHGSIRADMIGSAVSTQLTVVTNRQTYTDHGTSATTVSVVDGSCNATICDRNKQLQVKQWN